MVPTLADHDVPESLRAGRRCCQIGALDETMDKMWNRSAYVQTWRRAQEHIEKEREATGQRTFLEHFEALAKSRDA